MTGIDWIPDRLLLRRRFEKLPSIPIGDVSAEA